MTDISLDTLLSSLYRSNQNFFQFMDSIQKAYVDNNESIEFVWIDSDGKENVRKMPSIANLMAKLNNLERTSQETFDYTTRSISVKMGGGEIRKFVISTPMQNPPLFKIKESVTNFMIKENLIKDKLLDPYTSIEVPIDPIEYPLFNKFYYLKMVIGKDDNSISVFDQLFNRKIVNYSETLKSLESSGVVYTRSTGISEFMPKNLKNTGKFSVVKISRGDDKSDMSNNIIYTLSSIRYKNAENRDIVLKVGDKVINNTTTVYEVTRVIEDERKITVKVIEGLDPILRGVDNLILYSDKVNNSVEIPIGSEPRFILFIKPMNPVNQLVNNDWGTGTGVDIYKLKDSNNTQYFDGLTTDLWDKLKVLSESNLRSSSSIVTPRTPKLLNDYFSIQLLNSHKKEYSNMARLKELIAKKEQDGNMIDSLNLSLESIRESLSNPTISQNEEKMLKGEEVKILQDKDIASKSLKNNSNEIIELSSTTSNFIPKYGVVGIVPFTEPVYEDPNTKKGKQDVVAYELEYRYTSKDNKLQEFESKNISTDDMITKFIPSKWVRYENSPRKRGKNNDYIDETMSDPDVIKPNQYIIPITSSESIEMRIRGISESGYPLKQIFGEWSEILTIEFPSSLEEGMNNIIEIGKSERKNSDFSEELARQKLAGHASDSYNNKDSDFKHQAINIATNSKTPEQGNISVQAVLDSHALMIEQMKQLLSAGDGQIKVRLLDSDDKEIAIVKNNTIVKIDGGLYSEHVRNMAVKKGQIVNQTYYIEIENVGDGVMELISYVAGKSDNQLYAGYDGYIFNKSEYDNYRKYHSAPMVVSDIASSAFNDFTFGRFYQNKQTQGQAIYSRFRDVTLNKALYVEDPIGLNVVDLGTSSEPQQAFIWNGSQTVSQVDGNGRLTEFCVHVDHPSLSSDSFLMNNFSMYSVAGILPDRNYDESLGGYILPPFSSSKYSSRNSNDNDSDKQLYCKQFTKVVSDATLSDQIFKNLFAPEDQFLVGKKTCGSYIGIGSINREALEIINNSYNSGETMLKGEKRTIPIYTSSRLTDYYGDSNTGIGNIGGVVGGSNVRFDKTIGIDILYKSKNDSRLMSFDILHTIQYQSGNI